MTIVESGWNVCVWLVGVVSRRRVWLVRVGGIYGRNLLVWLAGGGCGWKLWVCPVGVVVRRYIDFIILLIPIPLVYICSFLQQHSYFLFFFLFTFSVLVPVLFYNQIYVLNTFFALYKHTYGRLQASHGRHN